MDASRPTIVVAEPFDAAAMEKLQAVGDARVLTSCDEASLLAAVGDCDALVVRTAAEVTRAVITRASRLKVIGRGGVGLDNIDIEAARERGIAVVYTPAASTDAVADLTLGFLIALVRNFRGSDQAVRAGGFAEVRRNAMAGDLADLTLGIVGLGRIGRAVARRASAFGLNIVYHDIVAPGWLDFVARSIGFEELLTASDIVSLHVPLTDATRRMIDAAALSRMKPTAFLINTSRGAVVDALALAEALSGHRLAGAALDVFDPEPLPPDHPLYYCTSTLMTPHLGAKTPAGQARMNAVVDDVIRVLRGREPAFPAEG